ncbi:MAG: class I mannose-6-phosphate isomerase [Chitinophagaceae bacterium]|nr:class I mannose-6-phosphate isomerase [Chitinophagaceae bacterium]
MKKSNFNKAPSVAINGLTAFEGWTAILDMIATKVAETGSPGGKTIVIECYQGVLIQPLIAQLEKRIPGLQCINAETALRSSDEIAQLVYPFVTDDPVFGHITSLTIQLFFDPEKIQRLQHDLSDTPEIQCIYGTGASLIAPDPDVFIYADMPRWEIQLRFRRNEIANLGANNEEAEFSYQYRRSFFVDWRVLDRFKTELFSKWDYVLDTTRTAQPKMVSGEAYFKALELTASQPFRLVPFFDPGPWGGQWLKEVCDLDRAATNYAWGFDCVPEENSLLLNFEGVLFETPAINLVFYQPKQLLGEKVYEAFGAEFPIRFDFLDTMEGGNLSLQVHPLKEYIREKFGMAYTQDESYYMLEAADDAIAFLGLNENINPEKMLAALEDAQQNGMSFPAEEYVQKWPVKRHDHLLIPAGTVHCSGANSVVLEISATPYIFTFKLWDWDRPGLDGKPRPISLEHGKKSIRWDRTADWVKDHIINHVQKVAEGDGWLEESTGLHPESFIETRRHRFTKKVTHHTGGVVNVINLVEGGEVLVESPSGAFAPLVIHYVETFIVPAGVGAYTIRPYGESEGKPCVTMKAYVRKGNLIDYKMNGR